MKNIHGGDIYTDGLLEGKQLIDFSSNINPLGVPDSFINHVAEGVEALNRYPDPYYRQLKKYILEALNLQLDYEDIILGNGAAEVLDLVVSCFKSLLIVVPSFIEYEQFAKKWGCNVEYSCLNVNMNYDYIDILRKFQSCQAMIIGNPNNPNGGVINKDEFYEILQYAENSNKKIIIDEAFIEFTAEEKLSFNKDIEHFNCLILVKALTKFYSLPGLRLGYGIIKDKAMAENIRTKQNPWNINCFGEIAAKYVLKDEEYKKRSLIWIKEEVEYFQNHLKQIDCMDIVYKSRCNFVLCKLKNISGSELYEICRENGVIIRLASNFRGLNDNYVRFAIKDRESNDILLNILRSIEI